MKLWCSLLTGAAIWSAPFLCADPLDELAAAGHDIVILGEVHDNPHHHALQARVVAHLDPAAVVFEMLTQAEADALADVPRDADALAAAVDGFQWNNLADYADILAASPVILGAAPESDQVRAAFDDGAAAVFGEEATLYGLDSPLSETEQETREALQFDAHCEAMPRALMGGMVEAQRLRDAAFARATLDALEVHGAPVVLITGNGHARADWGVPAFIARVAPDVSVFSLGQGEAGSGPEGGFDAVLADAPPVDRPDPCAAFR